MRLVLIFTLIFLTGSAGLSLDILTSKGEVYRNCEITRVEPDALRITHSAGVARVPYEELPSYLKSKHFDPQKVEMYRRQVAAERQAAVFAEEERREREYSAKEAARLERERLERHTEQGKGAHENHEHGNNTSSPIEGNVADEAFSVGALGLVGVLLALLLVVGLLAGERCPGCRKRGTAEITGRIELGRSLEFRTVKRHDRVYSPGRDAPSQIIERIETVPVTVAHYQITKRCSACNHEWTYQDTEEC